MSLRYDLVFFTTYIRKGILEFEVICLIEFRQFSVELEEKLDISKYIEISKVFKSDFLVNKKSLSEFVSSIHILETDVEVDESAKENSKFVNNDLPFWPITV